MSEINFSWKDVPSGWALCFNQSCPLHEHCLRYQAGVLAPPDLTVTRCVTPRVLTGERCKVYASMEPVKMARGFSTIYQNVLKRDYTPLRKFMTSLLSGKRYYYEYKGVNGPCLQSNRVTSDNCSGHSAIRTAYISTVTKRPYTSLGYS